MGLMLCIPSWLRTQKEIAPSSFHLTNVNVLELEVQCPDPTAGGFDSLPSDTKKHILSLLPVVDVVRGRTVCTEWRDILSSSPSYLMSTPSSSSGRETDFWKNLWSENRPWERWLFLHHGHLLNSLLYDVQRGICYQYPACPKFPKRRHLAASFQDVANTTANGLVFQVRYRYGGLAPRIWAYNPLTGCGSRLPDVDIPWYSNSWTIFAVEDVSSRIGPHYKLLLLGQTPIPREPEALPEEELFVVLYSSKDKRWERHESARVRRGWCYVEVNRFYEHNLIAILEVDGGSRSVDLRIYNFYRQPSLQILPFRAEADFYLKWFDVENYTWNSCAIFPPEDLQVFSKLKHFYMFDRNKELVLLASLLCPREFGLDFRVYKSTSTITPDSRPSWMFLSSMPAWIAERSGCRPFGRIRFRKLSKCQAFPFPDKILGDKLIIIFFENESFFVVSFNLESLEWKTITSTPDFGVRDRPTRERTPSEQKIGVWTRVTTQALRDNLLYRSTYESGSRRGFTLEPRLDDS